jgi:hypothetical protein
VFEALADRCGFVCAQGVVVGFQGAAAVVACLALYLGWGIQHK